MLRGVPSWFRGAVALVLVSGLCLSVGAAASADDGDESALGQSGGSLILVLDGSGSMAESAGGGQSRIEAAKDGLNGVIDKLPSDSQVGLRVYGSTIEDGKGSCKDSKLLSPVEKVDAEALKSGVKKLKPLGNTPIAYSLRKAYGDLPSEGPRSIVLVSDGEENCGGDPCEVAKDLKKKGADFYVDVVGLQVDTRSRNQLTCIASAGGGTYYDVQDLDQLKSTLTRTSVRAARGYEPAGLPIEGGTGASDAPAIDDGQWLDTIGDSGVEHYRLPDPGKGTLHVSAATPPSLDSGSTAAETIKIGVESADGQQCGQGARASVQGLPNAGSPLTAAFSATPKILRGCGAGPYVLSVDAPQVQGTQPLEVLVRSEPAVESTKGLPGPAESAEFSDSTEGEPPSGEPESVIGGPNFSSAPPAAPGTYTDSVLSGETLFYRVPDVKWGQQVVCDFTLGGTDAAGNVLEDSGYRLVVKGQVFGPLKSKIADGISARNAVQYGGKTDAKAHVATPQVRYLNRTSNQSSLLATDLDGDYYCSLNALPTSGASVKEIGEIPVTLNVSVIGDETGAPTYASKPKTSANDRQQDAAASADGGIGWPWIIGGLVVLAVVAGGLLAALRRRRGASGADAGHEDTLVDPSAGPDV